MTGTGLPNRSSWVPHGSPLTFDEVLLGCMRGSMLQISLQDYKADGRGPTVEELEIEMARWLKLVVRNLNREI